MSKTPTTDRIMHDLEQMKSDPERLLAACRIALSMAEFDRQKAREHMEDLDELIEDYSDRAKLARPSFMPAESPAEIVTVLANDIFDLQVDRKTLRTALVTLLDACKGHPLFPPALDGARNALIKVPA